MVTNAGALPSLAVAEFVFSNILMFSKGLPDVLSQQQMREWKLPDITLMRDLSVTVLGTGNIGSQLAKLLGPMGTKVIGINRSGLKPFETPFSKIVKLKDASDELMSTDFLVVAVPSSSDTAGMVSSDLLLKLKPSARIISVSRQNVLDLKVVVERLNNNLLASASLDTFDDEPLTPNHPLWTQKNLYVTPHCAFYYKNHYRDLVQMISNNFRNFGNNTTLTNVVEI
jgi:phosphoglycerate dehydrogenase-like enzyme